MPSDRRYSDLRVQDVPATKAQTIAEDIHWTLRTADSPALWTHEIVEHVDADPSDTRTVLDELGDRGAISYKAEKGERIWWIS